MDNTYLDLVKQTFKFPQEGIEVEDGNLTFNGIDAGNYNISVLHRYHLPIRTTSGVSLSATGFTTIDLTTGSVLGAKTLPSGKKVLHVGNVDGSNRIDVFDVVAVRIQNLPTTVTISNYPTTLDLNCSGRVDVFDIVLTRVNNIPVTMINLNN